jgi:outer membrane protein OmpA-like peptidoglycan-associated protein
MITSRPFLPVAVLLCAVVTGALGQSPDDPHPDGSPPPGQRFGIVGGMSLDLHLADFTQIPGIPNCSPGFRRGIGLAPSIALLYERPIALPWRLQARIGYFAEGATLTRAEQSFVDIGGAATLIDIDHSISVSLGSLGVEPLAACRLTPHLSLLGGGRIGYRIVSSYSQKEQLGDNVRQGSFENGRRVRNESAGDLPGASTIDASIEAGASYEIPLNASGSIFAVPELMLSYGLTPVLSSVRWSTHAIRAGVAIEYAPRPSADTVSAPAPISPPPQPAPRSLAVRIGAVGIAEDGTEESVARLRVEEFVAGEVRPLLGYIFFSQGSPALDTRYRQLRAGEVAGFDTASLYGAGTLAIYHQMLNIIGRRMLAHPSARLWLHGTTDGTMAEDRVLARRRAESVAAYLHDVWGIASDRLQADGGDLPSLPSNGNYIEGVEENRRVELASSDGAILAPLRTSDTLRAATPPVIRFHPSVEPKTDVMRWRVAAWQDGRVLKEFSGEGAVPEVLEWGVDREAGTAPRVPGEIYYGLTVVDSAGSRAESSPRRIGVEQVTVRRKRNERLMDMEVERYSLILFDYDRAELSEEHRAMVAGIREKIGGKSTVTVKGYADRLGDVAHNRKLALDRARGVAKALGLSEDRVEVEGEDVAPYEDGTPEGRFYSRTVTVEIRTPVVEGKSG